MIYVYYVENIMNNYHDNQSELDQGDESVLDRVLSETQFKDVNAVRPSRIVANVLNKLRDRGRDILIARYGLDSAKTTKETLESIGQRFSITRERVRQIEKATINKISSKYAASIKPLWKIIDEYMVTHGDIAGLDYLANYLGIEKNDAELEKNALRLAMSANPQLKAIKKHGFLKEGWIKTNVNVDRLLKIQKMLVNILEKQTAPVTEDKLINSLIKQAKDITPGMIKGALRVNSEVGMDSKGHWGLASWSIIVPRRIRDKVFIILEEAAKPLHFEEITKRTQEKFESDKPVLSRTVHNELISDKRFVLVGRGIYALKRWGYKPGVVADVIRDVLKTAGQPLHVSEIVKAVLERRQVKRNTIIANLQNKSLFKNTGKATYTIFDNPVDTTDNKTK